MRKDPKTFIVGEGITERGGSFGQTAGLIEEFGPERVIDMPISESAFVGMCAGAAACGTRAIVDIMYNDFTAVAFDQIINQAAKLKYISAEQYEMPLTILGVSGAIRSGGAQHSQSFHPLFMHIPGIIVVVPSNPYDMKGLLASAVLSNDLAVVFPLRGLLNMKGMVPEEDYLLPLGQALIIKEGFDVTVVASGRMVHQALGAAGKLAKEGISAEVIDIRTFMPLDENAIIQSVRKTNRLIIVDEGYSTCGVGAEIIARVQEEAFDYLDAPMIRVHSLNVPIPFSPVLEKAVIPDEEKIIKAVRSIVQSRKS